MQIGFADRICYLCWAYLNDDAFLVHDCLNRICFGWISVTIYNQPTKELNFVTKNNIKWKSTEKCLNTIVIQKVSFDGLLKENKYILTKNFYCFLKYTPYTIFLHNCCHCWCTYYSEVSDILSFRHRKLPPEATHVMTASLISLSSMKSSASKGKLIFFSIAHIKSSLTRDNHPLRSSSCTFLRPSLKSRIHLRTIKSLILHVLHIFHKYGGEFQPH